MTVLDPAIAEAVRALAAGELVCIPTESTYGLAARLDSPAGLQRLVALKGGRPASSPFPLLVPSVAAARGLARIWPEAAERLAARHWPGGLTLVVPARADLPAEVVGPGGGVGMRVSSHPLAAALVTAVGPITATSANRSGSPPATTPDEARGDLGAAVACYLAGGVCAGTASTVVAVDESGALRLVRAGAIDLGGELAPPA